MKQNSKEWLEKEAELKVRSFVILAKSEVLKEEACEFNKQIDVSMAKYPIEKINELGLFEREKIVAESEILFEQLRECKTRLRNLDTEYESVRTDVNNFYGEEIMPKLSFLDSFLPEDDATKADWWKKV